MKYKVVTRDDCSVIGLQVGMTTSQSENHKIIADHWKMFNKELRLKQIKLGGSWLKYGITNRNNDQYTYLTAIPKMIDVVGFVEAELSGGEYIQFEHRGDMRLLKSTIHCIYKEIIPEAGFDIDTNRAMIHYEQYDHRFLWNKPNSLINIYVPTKIT